MNFDLNICCLKCHKILERQYDEENDIVFYECDCGGSGVYLVCDGFVSESKRLFKSSGG